MRKKILAIAVPALVRSVTDFASVIDAETKVALENELRYMRTSPTNPVQMAVLTVESLEGETVESFAHRVFDKWELGDAGKDNGLLYVFALKERKYRIQTGYGMEGLITDGKAGEIGRLAVGDFRRGDYAAGIKKVVAGVHVTANPAAAENVYGRMPETRPVATGEPANGDGQAKEGTIGEMILGGFVFFGFIAFFLWRIVRWFITMFSPVNSDSPEYTESVREYNRRIARERRERDRRDDDRTFGGGFSGGGYSGGGGRSGGGGASGGW